MQPGAASSVAPQQSQKRTMPRFCRGPIVSRWLLCKPSATGLAHLHAVLESRRLRHKAGIFAELATSVQLRVPNARRRAVVAGEEGTTTVAARLLRSRGSTGGGGARAKGATGPRASCSRRQSRSICTQAAQLGARRACTRCCTRHAASHASASCPVVTQHSIRPATQHGTRRYAAGARAARSACVAGGTTQKPALLLAPCAPSPARSTREAPARRAAPRACCLRGSVSAAASTAAAGQTVPAAEAPPSGACCAVARSACLAAVCRLCCCGMRLWTFGRAAHAIGRSALTLNQNFTAARDARREAPTSAGR